MDMSATSRQTEPVRLLIADRTENDAYAVDSLLRNAGIATRFRYIDDLSMAADHINDTDLVIISTGVNDAVRAVSALHELREQLPVILLSDDASNLTMDQAYKEGASDLVHRGHEAHLLRSCQRELDQQCLSTRLQQSRRALAEAEQRCQLLLQSSRAAIAYVHEGMHIYANETYLKLFGYEEADDLLGLPLIDLTEGGSVEILKTELKAFRQSEAERNFGFTGQASNGETFSAGMTLAGAQYEGEHCMQVTLRTEAANDAGVVPAASMPMLDNMNRQPTIGEFALAAEGATRNANAPSKVIFIAEIDDMPALEQEHGLLGAEQICDRVELTLQTLSEGMPFLPLGRHRFALMLSGETQSKVITKADGLRQGIEELLLEVSEKTVRPTLSMVGVEQLKKEGFVEQLERVNRLADTEGMRRVNETVVHQDTENATVDDEAARVLNLINEAIEKQKFLLLFQPIISLRGDSDEHYEVFLRMLDRHGEQMVPRQFLSTAIAHNVAGKIDRWVILQSIKMLSVHRGKGHNTRLTINITANSVSDPEFIAWLAVAIKAARLPSDAVIFQITEEDALSYQRQTREFAEGLKKLHCQVALSRFGLVEDPYELLNHVPVNLVKIDGSLAAMETDADRERITNLIRKLQSIGKLTLVPMVENANMLSTLWQAGANYIQGHYLQEPIAEMSYDFSTDE